MLTIVFFPILRVPLPPLWFKNPWNLWIPSCRCAVVVKKLGVFCGSVVPRRHQILQPPPAPSAAPAAMVSATTPSRLISAMDCPIRASPRRSHPYIRPWAAAVSCPHSQIFHPPHPARHISRIFRRNIPHHCLAPRPWGLRRMGWGRVK